jgi:hypothetical protein
MGINITIFGLDLSLNSTGFCCGSFDEKGTLESISFDRFIYLDSKFTDKGKLRHVKPQYGVTHHTYTMPVNVKMDDLLIVDDVINREQIDASIKSMMCSKQISSVISEKLVDVKTVIFTIENFIMPSFGGKNQLKVVGSLINLQGYVREFIIRCAITYPDKKIKLIVPSPSTVKKFFAKDGNASKIKMIETFYSDWNGRSVLSDMGKIDDLVDSFALMQYAKSEIFHKGIRSCDLMDINDFLK